MAASSPGPREILLVFLRAPEKGRVKTRLAKDLGDTRALRIYRALVDATLAAAKKAARETWICFTPKHQKSMVQEWLGRGYHYLAQSGHDLGRRMAHAMETAFDHGADRVVLVGTDIPQIRANHIREAFQALGDSDVVLGPSLDGGYWLVGSRSQGYAPAIFRDMDWGGPDVLAATLDRCAAAGLNRSCLSTLRDVDTLADLEALKALGYSFPA